VKYIKYLKSLFTGRLNALNFFFAYILGWIVFFVLCFFIAIFFTPYIDTPIVYILPGLLWAYTATISFRRLCDIGIKRIIAAIVAVAVTFPFYWYYDEIWYFLIPLALLIILTATKGRKNRNKYGNPDSDGFMASILKIKLSEQVMDTAFRYTMFIACLVIVVCGTLIYTNRDQLNFPWMKTPPPQVAEQVKDDPYMNLINKGGESWDNGSTTDAMKLWREAEILDPSRPEAYTAESIPATGTEEMRLLNLAISKSSLYTPAYELRADAYNSQGKYKLALADATKAIELGGYTYHVYIYRAIDYINLNNDTLALSDSQEAIRMNPDDGQGYILAGQALYDLGMCQDAADAFNTAVDVSRGGLLEIKMRNFFLNTLNPANCVDSSNNSGQESPASTSTPTINPVSGVGA
jgi:tetratricopeptide (TPR) repeat protein